MKVIGITGGIGSGKSVATDIISKAGHTVLDADELSREAVRIGSPVLEKLCAEFGSEILSENGELNRAGMSAIIFGSPEKMGRFNLIMRDAIGSLIDDGIQKAAGKKEAAVFVSAALLYEAGWDSKCSEVWLITADDDVRARRAALRDGVSEEAIQARMKFQMPEKEKQKRATAVIDNSGSVIETNVSLCNLLRSLDLGCCGD